MSLSEYEKKVRTHALLMGIAFLVIIPTGVLIARYLRTFTNRSVVLYSTLAHKRDEKLNSTSVWLSQMVVGTLADQLYCRRSTHLCGVGHGGERQ